MNQMNANSSTNNAGTPPQTNPALRMQYQMQRDRLMQQQQKERLLQQQQKQSLVVPVNATAGADQLCKSTQIIIRRNALALAIRRVSTNDMFYYRFECWYVQLRAAEQCSAKRLTTTKHKCRTGISIESRILAEFDATTAQSESKSAV